MIIHQVFLKISERELDDFPCYVENLAKWRDFCEKNGWEHKLWTDIPYDIADDDDKFVLENSKDRDPFIPIDYIRYMILEKYGGMYVDLDVSPTEKFDEIKDRDIITALCMTTGKTHNNAVIKLTPELCKKLRQFCINRFREKLNIEIYHTWKKRFLLQSVGARMFYQFCKKEKIPVFHEYNEYFHDQATGSWFK